MMHKIIGISGNSGSGKTAAGGTPFFIKQV